MTRVLMFGLVFITMVGILGASCQAPVTTPAATTPTTTLPVTTTPTPMPTPTPTPTPTQAFNEVDVFDYFFSPNSITVPVGTTVTWTHVGVDLHTVTSNDDLFNRDLAAGESFSYTFTERGPFNYYCIYHPSMAAMVIVE